MATEKIALQVDVNTGKAVSNLGKLEKATKSVATTTKTAKKETLTLEQQFKNLNKQIKEEPVNIRAMNKQIQQYQAIALEAGRTSPLGREAIQKAAALKDKYVDIQNEVNRLANDGVKLKAALDLGSTVVAGFAGFQGIMALSGSKSEDLRKAMMKLQGAMALLMAVETIRKNLEKESTLVLVYKQTVEKAGILTTKAMTVAQTTYNLAVGAGSKAMKIFRFALMATGIGAIIAGIGLLIANFDKVSAAVKWFANVVYKFFKPNIDLVIDALQWLGIVASDEAQAQEAASKKMIKASEKRREEIDKRIEANKKLNEKVINGIDFEINKRKAAGKDVEKLEIKKQKILIKQAEEERKLSLQRMKLLANEWQMKIAMGDYDADQVKKLKDQVKENLKTLNESAIAIRDLKQQTVVYDIEKEKEKQDAIDKINDKAAADRKKKAEKKKSADEKAAAKQLKLDEKAAATKKKADEKAAADEIKREDKQYDLLQKLTSNAKEKELDRYAKAYEKRAALAKGNAELEKVIEEQKNIDLAAIDKKYADKEAAIAAAKKAAEDAAKDKEKEDAEEKRQQELDDMTAKLDSATAFLDSLQTLNNLAAGKSEKAQRKAFERNKKIQSAQAMISAAKGVVNILGQESLLPQPADGIYKGVQIAVLAATLGLQLKKINSAKFGGGGSGVTTPSLSGGGGGSVPTLNPVSNTNTVLGQENKVYVTETDISNTQNKVKVIEERATF